MARQHREYLQQEAGHAVRQMPEGLRRSRGRLQGEAWPGFRRDLQFDVHRQCFVLHSEAFRFHLHARVLCRRYHRRRRAEEYAFRLSCSLEMAKY